MLIWNVHYSCSLHLVVLRLAADLSLQDASKKITCPCVHVRNYQFKTSTADLISIPLKRKDSEGAQHRVFGCPSAPSQYFRQWWWKNIMFCLSCWRIVSPLQSLVCRSAKTISGNFARFFPSVQFSVVPMKGKFKKSHVLWRWIILWFPANGWIDADRSGQRLLWKSTIEYQGLKM